MFEFDDLLALGIFGFDIVGGLGGDDSEECGLIGASG
jgi:hypothetical protein